MNTATLTSALGAIVPEAAPAHPASAARCEATPAKESDMASSTPTQTAAPAPTAEPGTPFGERAGQFFRAVIPPCLGFAFVIGLWALVAMSSADFPGPAKTFDAAVTLFSDPFYRNGPNDQGIGWNILSSLKRVAVGFGVAALVGIPMGFIIGRFAFMNSMLEPIISILRPVSPLAWLPIGLMVFKAADPASTWTIFICSIWPMILNTAQGVQRVPQDYLNVARVLNLSEFKIITKILLPSVLPYMLTGIRLSIGTAWLVIVAAEMLTGGVGIGFWVWDEWNNLKVEHIIIAIFVIGIVGLLLEQLLLLIARRFSYGTN
ncbi:nitrate ABC transporter permease [Zoogloea sp.]|uniref:nitrate ABC transporter permease n=1 Tax=Zoogloea sp. TaxID=49181 RepID=UPI0031FD71E2